MAVTWPDGSVTGSVRVETPAPTPATPDPETNDAEEKTSADKKEVKDAAR